MDAMLRAAPAAGVECALAYRKPAGRAMVWMAYGLGHPVRRPWTQAHVRAGGRLIGWDLGYWNRGEAMRLTLDDDHPHRWIKPEPPARFDAEGIELREDADPAGPIVLVGLGIKQRRMKGLPGRFWEEAALARLRDEFPGRRVLYRPKRPESPLAGCRTADGEIDDVLRGASLVVTAHSNVSVDACIAGVPVRCEDGAALALYRDNPAPSRAARLDFLRSLAWWQWKPSEAAQAWAFIRAKLCV